jgi:hypothetical protein
MARASAIEARMRPTEIRDPRPATWYAQHRAEVAADPGVREFKRRTGQLDPADITPGQLREYLRTAYGA